MNIHQLSLSYLHEQDRILVRINSTDEQEIRLWLTRRLCLGWAPVLRQAVDSSQSNPTVGSEPQRMGDRPAQQSLSSSDFSTPFKADAKSWPLGTEPLVITTVHVAPHANGGMEFRFEESLSEAHRERSFQAVLAPALLHGFMHLLEIALRASGWEGLLPPAQMHVRPEQDIYTQHAAPQYLH